MKISSVLDSYVRRSLIGKYITCLRRYSPGLYALMKRLWEKTVPIRSAHNLARYQIRAIENFRRLTNPELGRSKILEIGSDSEGKIINELANLGVKEVTGINPGLENEEKGVDAFRNEDLPSGCRIQNDDAESLSFEDETFTHIFSVSVFEHLNNFDRCISEMYRVLKPGGYVYAEFGPIWSSGLGHHVYASVDGEEARHWDPTKNPVPNYAHLLMTKAEMKAYLENRLSEKLLEAVLSWVYDQPFINRMHYEEYIRIIEASPFEIVHLKEDKEHITKHTKELLENRYPGYKRFDVRNTEIVLIKN